MIEYLQPLLLSDKITFVNENMCCPVCGSIHFKKNGHDENHVQRYFCNHCHASFSSKTNLFITAFPRSRMKKVTGKWNSLIICRDTARKEKTRPSFCMIGIPYSSAYCSISSFSLSMNVLISDSLFLIKDINNHIYIILSDIKHHRFTCIFKIIILICCTIFIKNHILIRLFLITSL